MAFTEWARGVWREFGRREGVLAGIRKMHERVVRERAGREGLLAFKTGVGGLMELEFHVQALQMLHEVPEPNTLRALDALAAAGIIAAEDAAARGEDWLFLRRCEAAIRRMDNTGVSTLPADARGQGQVAVRLGFADRETFLGRYQAMRDRIHHWCASLPSGTRYPSGP